MSEFKRSIDRVGWFLRGKKQMRMSITKTSSVLRAEALTWAFEQIIFGVVKRRSEVGSDFYTKLKKIVVPEEQDNKSLHETHVCEAHDRVMLSFHQQVQGLARPNMDGSRNTIG